ncbi:unnamed protein product [Sphagnum troendelagicum]|uniref:Uncharacterized protein n=1 Tax=Sphagnum troendelagicum TaxID=128251 RepID=A0ABP0TX60_9BRYO
MRLYLKWVATSKAYPSTISEEVPRSDTNYCQRSVSSSPHALLFIHKEEDKSHAEEKADEMVQHGSWNYAFDLRTGGKTGPR